MDLIGAEIFDVGKWNGLDFSDDDLNSIAAAFDELSGVQKVPIKLGHNDKQPMTDGQPALGWVHRVYRQGSKLVADITDIPRQIYDAISKRLYRTVSVELLKSVEHKGKGYPWVLDAVALLGADQPAVNTLDELGKLTARRLQYDKAERTYCFETIKGKGEVSNMPTGKKEDDVNAVTREEFSKVIEKLDTLGAENADLKSKLAAATKVNHDREAEIKQEKLKAKREKIDEGFNTAIKAGVITPAQREHFTKLLRLEDDDAATALDLEEFAAMLKAESPKVGSDKTEAATFTVQQGEEGMAPDEVALQRAREFQAKHGEADLGKAMDFVFNADPKLARAYVDITGTN